MSRVDGREVRRREDLACEVVVVGSGPAGAAVARRLARAGVSVIVVEEGPWVDPAGVPEDAFTAMARYYRDMGASVTLGRPPLPFLQGRVAGGGSVINGAMWTGATQGHEVIGLRKEGLKFEALGYGMAIGATRLKGIGRALSEDLATLGRWANWGVAVRAQGEGRVRPGRRRARVRFSLTRDDLLKVRRGVRVLGEMMLAAGAEAVTPGIHGWRERVTDRAVMARVEQEAPLRPEAYPMAVTHMFGTCRMGSDPEASVVRPDFRHHTVERLLVADSSVFPTNTGVNPQTSIIALASLCAETILT